jgi:LAGLIDADG DNA endonuclease family
VTYSRKIEEYKEKLSLSEDQKAILTGLLLGDACLETQNAGRTYRLKIEQSVQHQAYVYHLYNLFADWVLTPPRMRKVISAGHESGNLTFQTISHSAFRFYAHQFYDGRQKRVPVLIHRWLTPKSLAYWFMDDGSIKSKNSKAVIFNTQCFSTSEVTRLCEVIFSKFGLHATIRKQKEGCQIFISGNSYEKFVELVSPFIINEMWYKIPKARKTRTNKFA